MKQFKDFPFKLFIPTWLLLTIVFYINFNFLKTAMAGDPSKITLIGVTGLLSTVLFLFTLFYFSKLNINQYLISGLFILLARWIVLFILFSSNASLLIAQILGTTFSFAIEFIASYYIINRFIGAQDYTVRNTLIFTGATSIAVVIAQTLVAMIFRNIPIFLSILNMAAFLGIIWLAANIMLGSEVKFEPNKSVAVHVVGSSPKPTNFSSATSTAVKSASSTASKMNQAGTQYRDQSHAQTAWIASHMTKYTPVVICQFDDLFSARNAIESLSFIKSTDIPGQYIASEIIEFGCYVNAEDKGEVIICGSQFSKTMYDEVKEKFTKAGGTIYRDQEPKEIEKPAEKPSASSAGTCKYVKTERNGMNTYEVYRGGSKADALAFLQFKTVTQRLYYIIVETPQGNFGKDIDGIFEE